MDQRVGERRRTRTIILPKRRVAGIRQALTIMMAMTVAASFGACSGESPTEVLPDGRDVVPRTKVELEYLERAMGAKRDSQPDGTYPGFYTNIYPGDEIMKKWLDAGPYKWVGYYLPAPCHKDTSWSGKRVTLEQMGWGLAVVYVGQQTWERPLGKQMDPVRTPLDKCERNLLNGIRGRIEADDAIARTKAEGFPRGSVIFLDIERMELMPPRMREYYKAWTQRLLEEGTYMPGYYAHAHNANAIYHDVRVIIDAMGKRAYEPPFWISSAARAKAFSIEKAPEDVGHAFAHVWQGMIDIVEGRGGVKLPIDVNVARTPNPSRPTE